jgi:hypothetical protein
MFEAAEHALDVIAAPVGRAIERAGAAYWRAFEGITALIVRTARSARKASVS